MTAFMYIMHLMNKLIMHKEPVINKPMRSFYMQVRNNKAFY